MKNHRTPFIFNCILIVTVFLAGGFPSLRVGAAEVVASSDADTIVTNNKSETDKDTETAKDTGEESDHKSDEAIDAEDTDEISTEDNIDFADEPVISVTTTEIDFGSGTEINPFFEDYVASEESAASGRRRAARANAACEDLDATYNNGDPYETLEGAGNAIADAMHKRSPYFSVSYKTTEDWSSDVDPGMPDTQRTILYRFIDAAVNDTDSAQTEDNCGDYLRTEFYKYGFSISCKVEETTVSEKSEDTDTDTETEKSAADDSSQTVTNTDYTYTCKLAMYYNTTADQEDAVMGKAEEIVSDLGIGAGSGVSDQAKIRAIYDYITTNVTYDYDNLNDNSYRLKQSAYGALINNTSVCEGYAAAFYLLCKKADIDAVRIITGQGNGGGHAWNIVKIGNVYYNLDSTWDAGKSTYAYFLKAENANDFDQSHVRNHYGVEGYVYQWLDSGTAAFVNAHPMASADYKATEETTITGTTSDGFVYEIAGGTAAITGYTGTSAEIIIPQKILATNASGTVKSYTVTSIKESAFAGNTTISSVSFETNPSTNTSSLTRIDSRAFQNCSKLAKVTLPEGLKQVGSMAFQGTAITVLNIPSTVTSFDTQDISGLTAFALDSDSDYYQVVDGVLYRKNKGKLSLAEYPSGSSRTAITIPAECSMLYGSDLMNATALQTVTLAGDTTIEYSGWFHGQWIVSSDNTLYKNDETACLLSKDGTILYQIPNTITGSFRTPDGVKKIAEYAGEKCKITDLVIGDDVTEIGAYAFYNCMSLKAIDVAAAVSNIGKNAFSYLWVLETVTFRETAIPSMGDAAWDGLSVFYGYNASKWKLQHIYVKTDPDLWTNMPITPEYLEDTEEPEDFTDYSIETYRLLLDEGIIFDFYIYLPEVIINDSSNYAVRIISGSGESTRGTMKMLSSLPAAKMTVNGKTCYEFTYKVYAKNMTDTVAVNVIHFLTESSAGTESGPEYTFSVRDYGNYILSHLDNSEYAKEANTVQALLNYGANAQKFFSYQTSDLANANLTTSQKDISTVTADTLQNAGFSDPVVKTTYSEKRSDGSASSFTFTGTGRVNSGMAYQGSRLELDGTISMRFYFDLPYGKDKASAKVSRKRNGSNGEPIATETKSARIYQVSGTTYYVDVSDIYASELGYDIVVAVTDEQDNNTTVINVTTSPLRYAYRILHDQTAGNTTETLRDLMRALYLYYEQVQQSE